MNKRILVLIVAVFVVIISLIFLSNTILQSFMLGKGSEADKLKNIANKNSQANQMLKDPAVKMSYSKLSDEQIQNFIKSGQIPSTTSKEIYMVDIISDQTGSGITLFIDAQNNNILKSQTVVEVGTG